MSDAEKDTPDTLADAELDDAQGGVGANRTVTIGSNRTETTRMSETPPPADPIPVPYPNIGSKPSQGGTASRFKLTRGR
ncbi:MAG: hypothetical protein AAGK00_05720 [Pseudomonadota bacterium]